MAFLCPVRIRRNKKKKREYPDPCLGWIMIILMLPWMMLKALPVVAAVFVTLKSPLQEYCEAGLAFILGIKSGKQF